MTISNGDAAQYVLAPITDKQAVNVARNALHTLVYHRDIGSGALAELVARAEEKGSDIRAAIVILDRFLETLPRDWKAGSK